jgi:predicted protein tyrosine phosphatase
MTEATAEGPRVRAWPWLVLALATVPAIWYVLDFESDIDPEFPRVVRPTFNTYPPPAYRFAEAGDTIDHVAVYVASAALVLSGWGCLRGRDKRPWFAALAISLAGFWHAATPGPLMDGWHGLGWRVLMIADAAPSLRLALAAAAVGLAAVTTWGLGHRSLRGHWSAARRAGVAGLFTAAALLVLLRQVSWLDREPIGFWPRWLYVWGLLAWALALVRVSPAAPPGRTRGVVLAAMLAAWLGLDFTGRGIFWYQRPIHRLREIVPDGIYLSAMPTYRGLQLAHARHHFRTIINLFPEHTPEGSPLLPDELRFAREHGINYLGNDPEDPTGEAFVARTLELARDPSARPILVHCHASMDRSPAWVGLYRFVVQGWPLADALREIECHRGLRPKASVTLLYNRMLPKLAPDRSALDPTAALLRAYAAGTVDPVTRLAVRPGSEAPQAVHGSDGRSSQRR